MKRLIVGALCLALALGLGACRIVSKERLAEIFDSEKKPELSAETILNDGIRPYALGAAKPSGEVLAAIDDDFDKACKTYGFRHSVSAFPCNFWIEVKGTIVKVDTESQSGLAWILPEGVDADPSDDEAGTVLLLIGPAIDSMGARDGFPGLRYEQFNDQTRFGAFGREINRLISKDIREKITLERGADIDVVGVLATWDTPMGNAEIVPVVFK